MPGPCDHSWHVRTRGERSRPRAPCRTRTPPARRRGYLPRLRDLGSGSEAHSMAHGATIRTGLIGYGLAGRAFHAPLIAEVAGPGQGAFASSPAEEIARDGPGLQHAAAAGNLHSTCRYEELMGRTQESYR